MPKSFCSLQYLRTPMGVVKVVNIAFGAISLILVGASYVPVWTLGVFLGTVSVCLCLSLLYITFYLVASAAAVKSKANRAVSFLFHVLAGTALIVAGIELIGWSEYSDPSCKHNCSRLYTVGIAKTLTFMNGTLYLIVAFLGVKDDDLLDPDAADEDIPLLTSSTKLTNIPGGSVSGSSPICLYDSFFRQNKPYCDDVRSNYIYRLHRPYNNHNSTAEHSFSNSFAAGTTTYGGVKTPGGMGGFHFNEKRNGGSVNGSVKNMPHSMPTGNIPELHFIKE